MAGCAEVLDDLGGEEILSAKSSSKEEALFDETMGHIQDILLDDKFTEMQRGFMDKHYHHFEDVEENKFIYTDIFKEYTEADRDTPGVRAEAENTEVCDGEVHEDTGVS